MKLIARTCYIGLSTLLATACVSVPKEAPEVFHEAKHEIKAAKADNTDEMFPHTISRADKDLDIALEQYKRAKKHAKNKNEPPVAGTTVGTMKAAIANATQARFLASEARRLRDKVNSWDHNIESFAELENRARNPEDVRAVVLETIEEVNRGRTTPTEGRSRAEDQDKKKQSTKEVAHAGGTQTKGVAGKASLELEAPVAFFSTGKATLNEQGREQVARLAEALRKQKNLDIRLTGHADPRGSADFNKTLSMMRAMAVAKELQNMGIEKNRIETEGAGASELAATEKDRAGQLQLLRRVDAQFASGGEQQQAH